MSIYRLTLILALAAFGVVAAPLKVTPASDFYFAAFLASFSCQAMSSAETTACINKEEETIVKAYKLIPKTPENIDIHILAKVVYSAWRTHSTALESGRNIRAGLPALNKALDDYMTELKLGAL